MFSTLYRRAAAALALAAAAALGLAGCAQSGAPLAQADTTSAATAQPQTAALASAEPQQFVLDNGLTLIVQPDHRAPTVVQMLWVRAGSMDEVDGVSGVAHMLEHMMFKGSAKLAPGEYSRRVAEMGGRDNAFTSDDMTVYFQQIPASKLPQAMALEAERFANSRFSDDEFARELAVVKEERRMRTEDDPRAMLIEQLQAAAFVASPYHRPVIGWMGDLDSLTADDVRAFFRQWYVPANAALVVAGDVRPEQALALARRHWGGIAPAAARALVRKPRPEPAQKGVRRIEVKASAEQAMVVLAFKVPQLQGLEPSPENDDALALTVLSAVLDGYSGARLERALTQGKSRVADAVSASNGLMGRGPQLFYLSGVPAPGKTASQVEAALRAQVARIAREGVSAAELARVKTQWVAAKVYERDSVMAQAYSLGGAWVQGLPLDTDEQIIARLKQITGAQVRAVAQKYFGDDQLTVGVLNPQPRDPNAPQPRPALAGARHGDTQ
ncbi:MAG: insulinase family protein [Burkholderiaceae bacterium]|nr:insulinase family protein [Burkholderiaceae bacterium]